MARQRDPESKQRANSTWIDPELCNGCGLCVDECPRDTLEMIDGVAVATGEHSLGCDHCAAICPTDAVKVGYVDRGATALQTLDVDDRWLPRGDFPTEQLVRLMRSRRSCRQFEADPVDVAVLRDLVRLGMSAPSGTNTQGWTFTILPERPIVLRMCEGVLRFFEDVDRKSRNPAARLVSRHLIKGDPLGMFVEQYRDRVRQAIDDYRAEGTDVLTWGAPAAIVIATRRSATTPVEDAAMASQNILLAAHAMGYATCMVGFAVTAMARDREIQRAVGIPMNERVRAVIAVGKTATRYQRVTGRSAATVRVVP